MVDDNKSNNENQKDISEDDTSSEGASGSSGTSGLPKGDDRKQSIYEVLQDLVDKSEYGSGPLVNQIVELHKKVGIVKKVLERILMEKLGKWRKSKDKNGSSNEHEKKVSDEIRNKLKK